MTSCSVNISDAEDCLRRIQAPVFRQKFEKRVENLAVRLRKLRCFCRLNHASLHHNKPEFKLKLVHIPIEFNVASERPSPLPFQPNPQPPFSM
jgi:hypothetical protein